MSQVPFLGVVLNVDGTYTDLLSGATVTLSQIRARNMTPFYGRFLDKDGIEHDVRDLIGSGSGTGGGIGEAPIDGQQYARQNASWKVTEIGRQFTWRGPFQLGNTYNVNDIVLGEDGNDYIAVMDGVVLPPPSTGWDKFLVSKDGKSAFDSAVEGGYERTVTQFYSDLASMQDLAAAILSITGVA